MSRDRIYTSGAASRAVCGSSRDGLGESGLLITQFNRTLVLAPVYLALFGYRIIL
jgi:hypothetical protein